MTTLTLNIGLDGIDAPASHAAIVASRTLRANGFDLVAAHTHNSHTERTLVVTVERNGLASNATSNRAAIYTVAEALNQDCIAVYNPSRQTGLLIGPRAEKWGEFNPEFFLQHDGYYLAPATAKAA